MVLPGSRYHVAEWTTTISFYKKLLFVLTTLQPVPIIDLLMACWEPGKSFPGRTLYMHYSQTISYEHVQNTVFEKLCHRHRNIMRACYILLTIHTYSCFPNSDLTKILTNFLAVHDFDRFEMRNHIKIKAQKKKDKRLGVYIRVKKEMPRRTCPKAVLYPNSTPTRD